MRVLLKVLLDIPYIFKIWEQRNPCCQTKAKLPILSWICSFPQKRSVGPGHMGLVQDEQANAIKGTRKDHVAWSKPQTLGGS